MAICLMSVSWIITEWGAAMPDDEFTPVTPGEMLKEDSGRVWDVAAPACPSDRYFPNDIAEIINNHRRITANIALRLSLYFGNSPEFWMNLQARYDFKLARVALKPEDAEQIKATRGQGGA